VDDALALLTHLGVEETHVVGSSAGGPIAIMLALAKPQMVRSLILANTAPRLLGEGELAHSLPSLLKELEEKGPLAFYRARPREAQVSILGPWERETARRAGTLSEMEEYEERLRVAAQALPEEEQAALYAAEVRNLAAYLEVDLLLRLKELRMPVLIVHGGDDLVVPVKAAHELHRAIPGSRLEVFPGVPHGILGFSREARLRILKFLRQVDEGTVGGG